MSKNWLDEQADRDLNDAVSRTLMGGIPPAAADSYPPCEASRDRLHGIPEAYGVSIPRTDRGQYLGLSCEQWNQDRPKDGLLFRMSEATITRLRDAILQWTSEMKNAGSRPDPLDVYRLETIVRTFDESRTNIIDEYQKIAHQSANMIPPPPIILTPKESEGAIGHLVEHARLAERERCAKIASEAEKEMGIADHVGFCGHIADRIRSGE